MTKKSQSRLQRDALATMVAKDQVAAKDPIGQLAKQELVKLTASQQGGPNRGWDELQDLYRNCLSIFAGYGEMARLLNNRELLSFMPDSKGFVERVTLLTRDLQTLRAELDQIYALHSSRTGDLTAEEGLASIEIFETYQLWIARHDGLILPTSNEINGMVAAAEGARNAAQQPKPEARGRGEIPGFTPQDEFGNDLVQATDAPVPVENAAAAFIAQ